MKIFQIILFISFTIHCFGADTLVLKKSIIVNSKVFTTDPLGNVYIIKDNNELIKYNTNGDSIGFFNEIKKGKVAHIDASNPLRVLLYFADYGNVLLLDNVLSLKSTLKLSNIGLVNVPCIAASADGNIWMYDPGGNLLKVNSKLETVFNIPLRNLLDNAIDPVYMTEQERNLYIVDSTEGVKQFDQFGLFKTSYPFRTREIQYFNKYLVYFSSPYLISYNTINFQENKILLPQPEDIIKARVERDFVFILRSNSLDIYSLPAKTE